MDHLLPSRFFATSGKALSQVSSINAFDRALMDAGIGEYNIVGVSSVLPKGIRKVKRIDLPRGTILHCVLASMRGTGGETISSGIAYAFRSDGQGGYVVEAHGHLDASSTRDLLRRKIDEMASLRGIRIEKVEYVVEEISVPMGSYGACVAVLALF